MNVDPIELLDILEPPAGWSERTDLEADPVAAAILERVLADDGSNVVDFMAARRRRRGIGGAIVVAALVAGGAVAAVWSRTPEEASRVTCWSEAVVPPLQRAEAAWDGRAHPVDICASQWEDGAFAGIEVPGELEACVNDRATVVVVPGDDAVCERLGYSEYTATLDERTLAINDARDSLRETFRDRCVPVDAATQTARKTLDDFGLDDWTITVADAQRADETCATVALNALTSNANVVPIPPG